MVGDQQELVPWAKMVCCVLSSLLVNVNSYDGGSLGWVSTSA